MRRRRKYLDQRQSDNHERWLVSYADFITLLFAFFVVMYALSTINEGKYRALSEALNGAFNKDATPLVTVPSQVEIKKITKQITQATEQSEPEESPVQKQREQMRNVAENVRDVLSGLMQDGRVKVTQSNRGISIEINASLLFASGQAQLRTDSVRALQQVSQILAATPQAIQVEGYTDDAPISTLQFPSNWELSAARASSVVRLFIENGVETARLSVIGYGPNQAVADNDSPDGRAKNRRVTVMLLAENPGEVIEIPLPEN